MNKQHSQVPNKMAEDGLRPEDQLIYAIMHRWGDGCFPTLKLIAKYANCSINSVRECIKRLVAAGYITVEKVNSRKCRYHFTKYEKFEPFSPEFLERTDLSFTEKAYIVASQQYMFKELNGIGKISYTDEELSEQINMPVTTIKKCDLSLKEKNYLSILKNGLQDPITGCNQTTKVFQLNELGQAIV